MIPLTFMMLGKMKKFWGMRCKTEETKIMIATKVGNQLNSDGKGWRWNPSKEYILKAVDKSLGRLRTDYIDCYQLHGGTVGDPIDEIIEAFELLKASGKIRNYGISSIRPNVIREYIVKSDIMSVMLQYSILDRRPEEKVLPQLSEAGIGIVARGALAKGLLSKESSTNYLNYSSKDIDKLKDKVCISSIEERSIIQTMLKWALHNKSVTTLAVGASKGSQLDEILATAKTPNLTEEEHEILSNLSSNKHL